jgi:hypothetical protein
MCKKLSLHTRPNPIGLKRQEKRNKNCQGQETTDSKRVERLENYKFSISETKKKERALLLLLNLERILNECLQSTV